MFRCSFCVTFHIFIAGGDRDLKFGRQVDSCIYQRTSPRMTKHPERSMVRLREPYKIWWAPNISLEWLKLELSNFAQTVSNSSLWMANHPYKWRGQGHMTHFSM